MSTSSARSEITLYETAFGAGELVWRGGLLVAHRLPDRRRGLESRPGNGPAEGAPAAHSRLERLLVSYFAGEPVRIDPGDLALDMEGWSAFALRLAEALARVEYGSTVSYAQLAAAAGSPRAARAVGNFLAANPFPVILACHRVIRANERIGGFSGGRQWKARLLALEKDAARTA